LRPLAEFGRESLPQKKERKGGNGQRRKRSNWTKAPLTLDGLQSAVERGRKRLAKNPDLVRVLERRGHERALIYKTLVLTGLRKSELASLTVGQLQRDGSMPVVVLDAADEKNRQGSTILLRADLANDLKQWLSDASSAATLRPCDDSCTRDSKRPVFRVPAGLVRILNRDLLAAGIDKLTNGAGRSTFTP
jgi:integrase